MIFFINATSPAFIQHPERVAQICTLPLNVGEEIFNKVRLHRIVWSFTRNLDIQINQHSNAVPLF